METLILILSGVLLRLLPHPANMTAIGGIALFSGAKLPRGYALTVTFLAMLVSDTVIGFHSLMWATYGSFAIAVFIGMYLKKRNQIHWVVGGTLFSSILFFIITNFAVWVGTPMYPKTIGGLLDCYVMAIPFFRNSLIGDMATSFVLFGSYEFGVRYMSRIKVQRANA